MLVVCLLGGPACGKNTQANLFPVEYLRVTSSEILDAEKARDPASPVLVSDEVVIPAVARFLRRNHAPDQSIIFNGFPRSELQVDFVVNYVGRFQTEGLDVELVFVLIDVSDGWAIDRNCNRWETTPILERRSDDDPRIYEERLRRSHSYIPAVMRRVQELAPGSLQIVDGMRDPGDVHDAIVDAIYGKMELP